MNNWPKTSGNSSIKSNIMESIVNCSAKDLKVLRAMPKRGIVDISDISAKTLYSPSTVKKTVSKLEDDGMVVRIKQSSKPPLIVDFLVGPEKAARVELHEMYELSEKGKESKHLIKINLI